jgi:hypothetical protein
LSTNFSTLLHCSSRFGSGYARCGASLLGGFFRYTPCKGTLSHRSSRTHAQTYTGDQRRECFDNGAAEQRRVSQRAYEGFFTGSKLSSSALGLLNTLSKLRLAGTQPGGFHFFRTLAHA